MPNLYGVANAPSVCFTIIGLGSSTACPAGVITPVFTTGTIQAPSQGWFEAIAFISLRILNGATPPTGLAFQLAIGAGSYNTSTQIGGAGFTASGSNYVTMFAQTVQAQAPWQGLGSTVTLGITAQSNATTVESDSSGLIMLLRAPDQ